LFIKYFLQIIGVGAMYLSADVFYCLLRLKILSRKAKKAEGLEQHKKIMREKDQKRKERKQVSLPAKHASKGKK
jgi:hypothetical protein